MILLEFSIYPIGKGESLSKHVSKSIDVVSKSKLPYKVGPMGTCIEGNWDEVFGVVKKCFNTMKKSSTRIDIHIKADYRKGRRQAIEGKIQSVEKRLRKPVKK